jgi:AcrR family transcriptional regulator
MPRTQEQFNEIRKQKRELIIDTALELFAEHGYHATTMSQIANKASISKGLAYNYFESKQEILDEIVKKGFDSVYAHFDLDHDGTLTVDEFRYFINETFNMLTQNRSFWKLFMTLMLQTGFVESSWEKYSKTSESIVSMLNRFIISAGSTNPESDVLSIAFLLKGAFLVAVTNPEITNQENITDNISEACFRLITKNS